MQIPCRAMHLRLIRNATLRLELDGRRLLVDPMLDPAGARPPVEDTENDRRNPLVELPEPAEVVVEGIDAVLVDPPASRPLRRHGGRAAAARRCRCCASPRTPSGCAGTASPTSARSRTRSTWEGIDDRAHARAPRLGRDRRGDGARQRLPAARPVRPDALPGGRHRALRGRGGRARRAPPRRRRRQRERRALHGRRPDRDGRRRRRRRRAPGCRRRASWPSTSTRSTTASRPAPTCTSGCTTRA